jgi:uncharacterized protein (TIGR00251 family)
VQITVRVKPGSRKGPLVESSSAADGAELTVYVQQRAVDGQANTAVVELLASHFGVAKSRVEILRGHASRIKTVRIDTN